MASETLIDEPLKEFTIPVREYTFWDKLLRKPKERSFFIYRIRVCNMIRCAGIAYKLPELPNIEELETMEDLTGIVFPLISNHKDDMVYLVACCIQNNSKAPKKSLIKFIDNNFCSDDLFSILVICMSQLGLQSFYMATTALKGNSVNIVKAKVADRAIKPE